MFIWSSRTLPDHAVVLWLGKRAETWQLIRFIVRFIARSSSDFIALDNTSGSWSGSKTSRSSWRGLAPERSTPRPLRSSSRRDRSPCPTSLGENGQKKNYKKVSNAITYQITPISLQEIKKLVLDLALSEARHKLLHLGRALLAALQDLDHAVHQPDFLRVRVNRRPSDTRWNNLWEQLIEHVLD